LLKFYTRSLYSLGTFPPFSMFLILLASVCLSTARTMSTTCPSESACLPLTDEHEEQMAADQEAFAEQARVQLLQMEIGQHSSWNTDSQDEVFQDEAQLRIPNQTMNLTLKPIPYDAFSTEPYDQGPKEDVAQLAFHTLRCSDSKPMKEFVLARWGMDQIQFNYECSTVPLCKDTVIFHTYYTPDEFGSIMALAHHPVICPSEYVLLGWHVQHKTDGQISIEYGCCKSTMVGPTDYCQGMQYTPAGPYGEGQTTWLDRHNVMCDPSYVLKSWALRPLANKTMTIAYECCGPSAFGKTLVEDSQWSTLPFTYNDMVLMDVQCPNSTVMSDWQLKEKDAEIFFSTKTVYFEATCSDYAICGADRNYSTPYTAGGTTLETMLAHNVTCNSDEVMRQWHLTGNSTSNKMDYTCCKPLTTLGVCKDKVTVYDDRAEKPLKNLEDHPVKCGAGSALQKWALLKPPGTYGGFHIQYTCCTLLP